MNGRSGGVGRRWYPGQELEEPLEDVLDEYRGLLIVLTRLRWALSERRESLDADEVQIFDVLEGLACVLPPTPGLGMGRTTEAERDDLAALAGQARQLQKKYRIRTVSKFGDAVVSIVANLVRQMNSPPRAARSRPKAAGRALPKAPARPVLWPQGATDTPEGRHSVFSRLAAPLIRQAASELRELRLGDNEAVEAKLRGWKKLARLIDAGEPPTLAIAVLRALEVPRPDNIVNGARLMRARREQARKKGSRILTRSER